MSDLHNREMIAVFQRVENPASKKKMEIVVISDELEFD